MRNASISRSVPSVVGGPIYTAWSNLTLSAEREDIMKLDRKNHPARGRSE